jgi:flagellar biosynthesis anti-sigma factor FlgM
MRIDQNLSALIAQQSCATDKTGSKRTGAEGSTGSVTSLDGEGAFATLTAASSDLGQARAQRVQALQDAVASGSYRVQPEKVADAMLASALY